MFPNIEVPYTQCRWTADDLHLQIGAFDLTYPPKDGIVDRAEGVGLFMVLSGWDGMKRLIIDITNVDWLSERIAQDQHPVLQQHAGRIERHPESNSGKAHQPKFRVLA